jgi:hypothetical protein
MYKKAITFFLQEKISSKIVNGELVSVGIAALFMGMKQEVIHFAFVMLIGLFYPFAVYFGKFLLQKFGRFLPKHTAEVIDERTNGEKEPPGE